MKVLAIALSVLLLIMVTLFFAGRWLSRYWSQRHPTSHAVAEVTPTGMVLYGCLVLALVVGAAVRKADPDGPLGLFLNSRDGLQIAIVVAVVIFALAWTALELLGHSPIRRKGDLSGRADGKP
jgi:hypothetical protein